MPIDIERKVKRGAERLIEEHHNSRPPQPRDSISKFDHHVWIRGFSYDVIGRDIDCCGVALGIPVKVNIESGGKPNGVPERSNAGVMIVQEVFGFVH